MTTHHTSTDDWEKELKELLDNPRTGLRDSSDTNKTRYAILTLFDEIISSTRATLLAECVEEVEKIEEMHLNHGSSVIKRVKNIISSLQAKQ